jgi:hypothetical protein
MMINIVLSLNRESMKRNKILILLLLIFNSHAIYAQNRWSPEKANEWYQHQGWLTGANFTPSTAVNQLEMWQAETFDTATINKELGYAENIGFNIMRVYLHHVAWQEDSTGFKERLNQYLAIANKHKIKTMFVFFDDCWNDKYHPGLQPPPKPGVHNSGWLKDPGSVIDDTPALMDTLERYVKDILNTFKEDERVSVWDLYNEPGHFGHGDKSWPLLKNVVKWAREVKPEQPITIGIWNMEFTAFNQFQIENSDVISFHNYRDTTSMISAIDTLKLYGRPILCTEYMKRPNNSTFATHFPILKKNQVAAINWGLVAGKTQTNYAQGNKGGEPEPAIWYHDIFRKDGSPFDPKEVELIKDLNKPVISDGPYVTYSNGKGYITTITNNIAVVDSFKEKSGKQLLIKPSRDSGSFSLKLHPAEVINEPCIYPPADKLVVVSDIEGEFYSFVKLMIQCKVIDNNYNWIFGKGHLVICGDLFDRGRDVNAYLWLLYKLDLQAKAAGGYEHVILGNHDIMNLSGDYRYVDTRYFEAAKVMQKGYKDLYSVDTELGRWLRSKNIIEKVGDLLFMHAGIAAEVNNRKMSLTDINSFCRPFYDQPGKDIPDSLKVFFGPNSPFWYRGYFKGDKTLLPQIDQTLAFYDCKHIIVGHTIVDNIQSLYNGKVIGIDVNQHEGDHQVLLIEKDQYYRIDANGERVGL